MVLAHSEISISDDGSTSITVLPFEGAEDTYSSLLDSFKKTLGDQKFADFLELGEPALRKNFNQFGGAKLVATISRDDKNSTEDKTLYKVVEKVESMGNTSSTTSNNISEEKLAKDYGLIKQLADWKSQQP